MTTTDGPGTPTTAFDFDAVTIDGAAQALSAYHGKVLLIVNTASECGYTPQYAGLQELFEQYAERGFAVLGFPCDQFGHQEPGTEDEIKAFCSMRYATTFPMFAKIDVNGRQARPLFRWLTAQRSGRLGRRIAWNFTKFLVDRDGAVVGRYGSTVVPAAIAPDIEQLLH